MSKKIRVIAGHIILFFISFNPPLAYAASNIVPDGSTNTNIDRAQNGITMVNIAAPNPDGVSNNRFDDLNVAKEGAIFNNSDKIGITQLGGAAPANPNLVGRNEADIILAQVTSSRKSNLEGYIEIFGKNAQFILANPNGISCNGCGFLNTSKLTLATGNVRLNNAGNLIGIDVSDYGNFVVGNLGLDASRTDYFDIITRAAQIGGSIWSGNEVAIKTGRGQYDVASGKFLSSQSVNDNLQFAIDASAFGSIYAGKISLMATELGLGVRNLANLVADTSDVNLQADGKIIYNNIGAKNNINITSNSDVSSQANSQAIAGNNYNLEAVNFKNSGEIFANDSIKIGKQNNLNNFINNGQLTANNIIDASANSITNNGLIFANSEIDLTSTNDFTNSGNIGYLLNEQNQLIDPTATINIISINGDIINNLDSFTFGYNVNLATQKDLTNAGNIISINDFTLGSQQNKISNINNSGTVKSYGSLLLNVADNLTNSGNLYADSNLDVTSNQINNSGLIFANSKIDLTSANDFTNSGDIGYLLNQQNQLVNPTTTVNITSTSGDITNQETGNIFAQDLTINTGKNVTNSGNIKAINSLAIGSQASKINDLNNYGVIQSYKNLSADIAGKLTNQGSLYAEDSVNFKADSIDNSGLIFANSKIDLTSASDFTNSGDIGYFLNDQGQVIVPTETINIIGGNFANQIAGNILAKNINFQNNNNVANLGNITATENLSLGLQDSKINSLNNSGTIKSYGSLSLNVVDHLTNSGSLYAEDSVNFKANSIDNSGLIFANSKIDLTSASDFTNSGDIGYLLNQQNQLVNPTTTVNITSTSGDITNQETGNIFAQDLTINTSKNVTNSGNITAINSLAIGSQASKINDLNNYGVIQSYKNLSADIAGKLTNQGSLYADDDLNFKADSIDNSGLIFASSKIDLTAINNITNSGDIGYFLNDQGQLINPTETVNITSTNGNITNQSTAKILADQINLDSSKDITNSGNITAVANLNIASLGKRAASLTNSGILASADVVNIYADVISNLNGRITANGKVHLDNNRHLYNHEGLITANEIEMLVGNFSNSGSIKSTSRTDIDMLGDYTHNSGENLISNGLLKLKTDGSFTNNSNLVAGSINVDARNIVNNDLILANDVAGLLSLTSRSGDVVNNNKIESKNNLLIDSADDISNSNSSRILAMNNLLLQADNNINNNYLIYAKNSAIFDFTNLNNNSSANIFALNGDLNFGKNYNFETGVFDNRATLLNNNTANIQAGRDIFMKVADINNLSDASSVITHTGSEGAPAEYRYESSRGNYTRAYPWRIVDWQEEVNSGNKSNIGAGRDLTITANNLTNKASNIEAIHDIRIDANVINQSNPIVVHFTRIVEMCVNDNNCNNITYRGSEYNTIEFNGSPAILAAGNNLYIKGNRVANSGIYNPNAINHEDVTNHNPSLINGGVDAYLDLPSLSGIITVNNEAVDNSHNAANPTTPINTTSNDNSNLPIDVNNSGIIANLVTRSKPTITYLAESNPDLIDTGKLIGSGYFLERAGFNSDNKFKLLGDSYIENQIIREQILRSTGRLLISSNVTSFDQQMTMLYENAINESKELQLSVGVALNKEQIAALKSDMIWLVEEEVKGVKVLVPTLYLTQLTKDNLKNSGSVISGNNVQIAAKDFANKSATISAANNVILDIDNDVVFAGNSKIIANNSIISANNLNLFNSNLDFTGNSSLQLKGDLNLLSRAVSYQNGNTTGVKNYGSNLNIAGNFDLSTGGNFSVMGGNVNIGGDGNLKVGKDFNLASVADTSYTRTSSGSSGLFSSKSTVTETWTVNQKKSSLTAGGDLTIKAGNDVNIIASKLDAKDNLNILANNKVSLLSVADYSRTDTTTTKKSFFSSSQKATSNIDINQIVSNAISGGNLTSYSGGDTKIVASNMVAGNNVNIVVGKYLDENNNVQVNKDAKLDIQNAMDSKYSFSYEMKTKMDLGAVAVSYIAGGPAGLATGIQAKRGSVDIKETYDETTVASNIIGKNISLSSASDINLISSNLKAENNIEILAGKLRDENTGAIVNINSNANLLIGSAQETHTSYEKHETFKPNYLTVAISAYAADAMSINGQDMTNYFMPSAPNIVGKISQNIVDKLVGDATQKFSDLTQTRSVSETSSSKILQSSSNIIASNDLNAISANNINISASNINVGNNANLLAGNLVSIVSALEESSSKTSEQSQKFNGFTAGVDRGRASAGITFAQSKDTTDEVNLNNKSSNISAGNDLNIVSKNDLSVIASNLGAKNDINLLSTEGSVNIKSALDTKIINTTKDQTTASLTVGVGNAYIDAHNASDDNIKAAQALKDAKSQLDEIKSLRSQGKASEEAVHDAEANLAIATANLATATLQNAKAAANAASAASTSDGTGFYFDARLNMATKEQTTSEQSQTNIASNIVAGNNINLNANLDINQIGSNLNSTNGDINYAALRDINIGAAQDTYSYKFKEEDKNASVVLVSSNPLAMASSIDTSIGFNSSKQSNAATTYQNSTATANQGSVNINSGNDANIVGANLLGQNIVINVANNLNVASLQNESHSSGSGIGASIGYGSGSGSVGFNTSNNNSNRLWVDNQTSLVGSNVVDINIGNNTDIKGALIANLDSQGIDQGNLNINTAGFSYSDINNSQSANSSGFGVKVSGLDFGQNDKSSGTTNLSIQNQGSEKTATANATIGQGTININGVATNDEQLANLNRNIENVQEITKDTITGALDSSLTIDNRLFTVDGRDEIVVEMKNLKQNLQISNKELIKLIDSPLVEAANYTANVPVVGTATSLIAGQGGSVATLASQLLGVNYLLDSSNSRLQDNVIVGLDNATLAKYLKDNNYKIKLEKDLGTGDEVNGRSNSIVITDSSGNIVERYKTTNSFKDLRSVSSEDIVDIKDYSLHGIYNTSDQAMLNGLTQLGQIQNQSVNNNNGQTELNFSTINAPSKGLILDGAEVAYNLLFGSTPLSSANMTQAKDFGQTLATAIQDGQVTNNIKFVAHSGGGDRLQQGVLFGAASLDLGVDEKGTPYKAFAKLVYDSQDNPIYIPQVSVQFFATPSMTSNLGKAAENAGAYMAHTGSKDQGNIDYTPGHKINSGDPVGNILGLNAIIGKNADINEAVKSIISIPLLFKSDLSPHSDYKDPNIMQSKP